MIRQTGRNATLTSAWLVAIVMIAALGAFSMINAADETGATPPNTIAAPTAAPIQAPSAFCSLEDEYASSFC